MGRYVPTITEQECIDQLTLAGYKVVRERTYAALLERVRLAEAQAAYEQERREGVERWALDCCAEERRLEKRLNAVCYAAAALGVSIIEINKALDAA